VYGAHDGVKQYLEEGRKAGRELGRDELDERIVLAGDLDLTDSIIQSIDAAPNVDRYLSITLSFKEDHVDVETLRAVVRDFERFAMHAYRPDEYCFYAEAHLPRVKSYLDEKTGELVERKPHIHIVIPKTNLISGQALRPFGFDKYNLDYIDAFQEHTNAHYGFASPKDNRRTMLTDASEMISRYRGDLFRANSRALKEQLLDAVLDRQIENHADFMALLHEYGAVRMRNAGSSDAYPNVKPAGADKGVNLKEYVFTPEFIALPTAEKLQALSADAADQYEAGVAPRRTPDEITTVLDAWYATRARELKYLNSGSRLYQRYQESSPHDRKLMLADLEREFYAQHLKAHHERAPEQPADFEQRLGQLRRIFEYGDADYRGTDGRFHAGGGNQSATGFRPEPGGPAGVRRDPFDAVHRQFDFVATAARASSSPVDDLRNLSGRTVERIADRPAVLVPHHAYDELEPAGAVPAYRLRRSRDRDGEFAAQRVTGRVADNAVSQLARDARQHQAIRLQDAEFAQIRRTLDAHRLLAALSYTHGVRPAKYAVVTGRDGGDRIRAGKRHLNVSDFLTKELNLPWQEAAPLLQAVYARQLRGEPVPTPKELPRAVLWRAYSVDRDAHGTTRREAWAAQRASEQQRAGEIRTAFTAARTAIRTNLTGGPAARRAAISIARVTRIEQETALRHAIARERDALRARYGTAAGPSFADWLRARAEQGDERALAELRRTAQPLHDGNAADHDEPINEIRAHVSGRDTEPNAILYRAPALSWSVDPRGQVTYRRDGVDVVRDRGANVQVLQPDHTSLETGLRLAQAKFGRTLELAGHDAFQLEAVKVAVARGLDIQFSDARLNEAMHALRKQRVDALARDVLGPTSAPNKDGTHPAPDQPAPSADPKPGI
jgi:hypothetical protein